MCRTVSGPVCEQRDAGADGWSQIYSGVLMSTTTTPSPSVQIQQRPSDPTTTQHLLNHSGLCVIVCESLYMCVYAVCSSYRFCVACATRVQHVKYASICECKCICSTLLSLLKASLWRNQQGPTRRSTLPPQTDRFRKSQTHRERQWSERATGE